MRYIELQKERKEALYGEYRGKVSRTTLWGALTFKWNSDLAKAIRRRAFALGGRVMNVVKTEGFVPNCEIAYSRVGGAVAGISQTWRNGVRLDIDMTDDTAVISVNGERACDFTGLTLSGWGDAVLAAQSLSDSLEG